MYICINYYVSFSIIFMLQLFMKAIVPAYLPMVWYFYLLQVLRLDIKNDWKYE